jgi:hypothetical protein
MRRKYQVDGVPVPGVTSVLGQLGWAQGALMWWANQAGLKGQTLEEARQTATGVGTRVHDMIEADLTGRKPPFCDWLDDDQELQVQTSMSAFQAWRDAVGLEVVEVESEIVDAELMIGGRIDLVARVSGNLSIVDWKTAKAIYPKDLCQVAAYANMWSVARKQKVTHCHILRVGKDDGSFHHHCWSVFALSPALDAFMACLRLRGIEKTLRGML